MKTYFLTSDERSPRRRTRPVTRDRYLDLSSMDIHTLNGLAGKRRAEGRTSNTSHWLSGVQVLVL